MAIKQRKQLTGTTAQINAYAGVEGQLVWDKTKKKWVGMSGTAGTNYPVASEKDLDGKLDVTGKAVGAIVADSANSVDWRGVKNKPDLSVYATTTALTEGLAGKANASHTHLISNITGLQGVLDNKIPTVGERGIPAGYETWAYVNSPVALTQSSADSLLVTGNKGPVTINISGVMGKVATKFVWINESNGTINFTGLSGWFAKDVPTLKKTNLLVILIHDTFADACLIGAWD